MTECAVKSKMIICLHLQWHNYLTHFSWQAEEKAVHESEQLLNDLRKRSTTIVPLKQRRTNIKRPTTVESLCDWETDKVELLHLKLQ